MANRSDNLPKRFREVPCIGCGSVFQSTGPNHKRCEPCGRERHNEAGRQWHRSQATRLSACLRCRQPFPPDVHGHQRHCSPCGKAVRREKNMATQARRIPERYRTDAGFRLHLSVSVLIRRALRDAKNGRTWPQLVGYNVADLKTHLERQFVKGMKWENYGSAWHVDHIIPRAVFDFKTADDPDFKACWAMSNLRPLWAEANRRKNAKRTLLL